MRHRWMMNEAMYNEMVQNWNRIRWNRCMKDETMHSNDNVPTQSSTMCKRITQSESKIISSAFTSDCSEKSTLCGSAGSLEGFGGRVGWNGLGTLYQIAKILGHGARGNRRQAASVGSARSANWWPLMRVWRYEANNSEPGWSSKEAGRSDSDSLEIPRVLLVVRSGVGDVSGEERLFLTIKEYIIKTCKNIYTLDLKVPEWE